MAQSSPQTIHLHDPYGVAAPAHRAWLVGGWLSVLALLLGVGCLIYLIATSSLLGAGYDLQRLERQRGEWQARNEQLRVELAKVRSLVWVEAQATHRLGMVKPDALAFVQVNSPAVARVPVEPGIETLTLSRADEDAGRWNEAAVGSSELQADALRLLAERLVAALPGQP